PLFAWNLEDLAHAGGNRVGNDVCPLGDAQAEAAEVVVLVVVRVPAAVVLHEPEIQHDAICESQRLLRNEHSLARLVAPPGPGVDAPGRLLFPINGVFYRSVNA